MKVIIGIVCTALLALELYQILKNQSDFNRKVDNGVVEFKKGNYKEAVKLLEPLSQKGDDKVEYILALSYVYSNEEQSVLMAQSLLKKFKENPEEDFYQIAQELEAGTRVSQNKGLALSWYKEAAKLGHDKSIAILSQKG